MSLSKFAWNYYWREQIHEKKREKQKPNVTADTVNGFRLQEITFSHCDKLVFTQQTHTQTCT